MRVVFLPMGVPYVFLLVVFARKGTLGIISAFSVITAIVAVVDVERNSNNVV